MLAIEILFVMMLAIEELNLKFFIEPYPHQLEILRRSQTQPNLAKEDLDVYVV